MPLRTVLALSGQQMQATGRDAERLFAQRTEALVRRREVPAGYLATL